MFSTSPSTGAFACAAMVIDLRTTRCETSDGIVTTIVPDSVGSSEANGDEPVGAGRQVEQQHASAPQAVSARNIAQRRLASMEPRHVCDSACVGASQTSGARRMVSSRVHRQSPRTPRRTLSAA